MFRILAIFLALITALVVLPAGSAFAQTPSGLNLPPGIAAQAEPLLIAMTAHMESTGMSSEEIQTMSADMQTLAAQLPPGIFLQILRVMPRLDMAAMMTFHQQIEQGQLLQQPPGQILTFVFNLAS